jgi:DNA-binding transcriptional LysR family regulator
MSGMVKFDTRLISVDDLRIVLAVAHHGSFVAAARHTGVPSSTVSRAVARLEEALGVRFFQRTSRSVSLTDEGARLVERATPLFDELREVIDDLAEHSSGPAGRLRVTAPMVSGAGWLGSALLAFAKAHPRVSVELSLSNAVVDLVEQGFDLAFRGGPIEGSELISRRILSVPYAIGASRAFIKRELGETRTLDRGGLESLLAILPHPKGSWSFQRADGSGVKIRPRASFCVNDQRVAVDAAALGLGAVLAPVELVAATGLVALGLGADVGTPESRDLYAVYPSKRLIPKRVRLAIDWVARAASATRSRGKLSED